MFVIHCPVAIPGSGVVITDNPVADGMGTNYPQIDNLTLATVLEAAAPVMHK
jgi:hypothetical protein